ncbi:hypothetical protein MsAm2_14190 [Methanolapillus ohkumae]|uniref:Uncharacterized protein n=1 Tax=Methanolapillus ohkumae TaxID=3028298 RepID=A0AA96VFQ6_9EURY|nr:hypothetical protein MsAm2_14190 [Methanosarcinaceae archaeon Am2]
MIHMLQRNEKNDNLLFAGLYLLGIFLSFCYSYFCYSYLNGGYFIFVLYLFWLLSSTIYGLFSRNVEKSLIFGFLMAPVLKIFVLIFSFILPSNSEVNLFSVEGTLLLSVFLGLLGYYMANDYKNKWKTVAYVLVILILLFIFFRFFIYKPW